MKTCIFKVAGSCPLVHCAFIEARLIDFRDIVIDKMKKRVRNRNRLFPKAVAPF